MGRSQASPGDVLALKREAEALELRIGGARYAAIGRHLGITEEGARQCVLRGVEKLELISSERSEEVKRLELMRLDDMLKGVWLRARGGDLKSIDAVLRIMDRRTRYLGLDKPIKLEGDWKAQLAADGIPVDDLYEQIVRLITKATKSIDAKKATKKARGRGRVASRAG